MTHQAWAVHTTDWRGNAFVYARCACSWRGIFRVYEHQADADGREHVRLASARERPAPGGTINPTTGDSNADV